MGQGLDRVGCDAPCDADRSPRGSHKDEGICQTNQGCSGWDEEDALVGCGALETNFKQALASANRGGAKVSGIVLQNHELLQHARQGNYKGVSAALEKGAWTETRRPLVMKPQKPETNGDGSVPPDNNSADTGMTALMFSAQAGSEQCVRRLLWAHANVNAVEEDGWSSLHFAAKEGNLAVCEALLLSRADATLVNIDDRTPLQVAEAEEDTEFSKKLKVLIARSKPASAKEAKEDTARSQAGDS